MHGLNMGLHHLLLLFGAFCRPFGAAHAHCEICGAGLNMEGCHERQIRAVFGRMKVRKPILDKVQTCLPRATRGFIKNASHRMPRTHSDSFDTIRIVA